MSWLLLASFFILPFVFTSLYRRSWARWGLAAFWLTCAVGAVFSFLEAAKVDKDLATVHRYELPSSAGEHTIPVRRLSQGSMLGVLEGGEGRLSRPNLDRLKWSFPSGVYATWFEVEQSEEVVPSETPLFRVECPMGADPVGLTYRVEAADAGLLKSRVLIVRHDQSARHLLRDHWLLALSVLTWGAGLWAALWLGVQVVAERKRRRPEQASR
jgi:hypothetical protein